MKSIVKANMVKERVLRECEINCKISHPNITRVYEIYESSDEVILIMDQYVLPPTFLCSIVSHPLTGPLVVIEAWQEVICSIEWLPRQIVVCPSLRPVIICVNWLVWLCTFTIWVLRIAT